MHWLSCTLLKQLSFRMLSLVGDADGEGYTTAAITLHSSSWQQRTSDKSRLLGSNCNPQHTTLRLMMHGMRNFMGHPWSIYDHTIQAAADLRGQALSWEHRGSA